MQDFFLCFNHKMSNVFERARNIRMVGEPWQNAVQRAGSQLRYEGQVGGAKAKKPKKPKKHCPATDLCFVGRSGRCKLSGRGKRDPAHRAHPNVKAASDRAKAFDFGGNRAAPRAKEVGSMGSVSAQRKRRPVSKAKEASQFAEDLGIDDLTGAVGGAYGQFGGIRGRKAGETAKSSRCAYNQPTARCRQVPGCYRRKPSLEPVLRQEHKKSLKDARFRKGTAGPEWHNSKAANTPWQLHLKAFRKANPHHKEAMKAASETYHAPKKATVARKVSKSSTLGGGWDGFSDTSSTRSSDFTSVSDTTSYSASTDSSSMW